jgi:murein DD-endopeptidase MepM/ murein hydrolase activator NlpD
VARRVVTLLALALLAATPAAGGIVSSHQRIQLKIGGLQERIDAARGREAVLKRQIAGVTVQIRALERRVGGVATRLAVLERDLELHRRRLHGLDELFRVQTARYDFLRGEYRVAVGRLNERLVSMYETGRPSSLEVLLVSRDLTDMLDQLDYLHAAAAQDHQVAAEVGTAKREVRRAWVATRQARLHLAGETQVIQVRAEQVVVVKDQLLAAHGKLTRTRGKKRRALHIVQESEREFLDEVNSLQAADARVRARIAAAQGGYTGTPSASGLIWPVDGPVTSPFGERWGRLHAGIDIGVPYGTPIRAAAAGRVIYCGWEEGYGNLTLIDHGGGIVTAYAHQSSIAVSCGQDVTQGQVIGSVGCTGHCFGPHLHFEVRVNGTPVDPLGYL